MSLRQAAEQALKYFEDAHGLEDTEVEIKDALRQALAQPEWVGLTEEDMAFLFPYGKSEWVQETVKIIEAKLRERNT